MRKGKNSMYKEDILIRNLHSKNFHPQIKTM